MTKFENSWGIDMREGLAVNSLSQLEGRWRGRGSQFTRPIVKSRNISYIISLS
jgi:hypothetical protein